jgi:hypothetical protein
MKLCDLIYSEDVNRIKEYWISNYNSVRMTLSVISFIRYSVIPNDSKVFESKAKTNKRPKEDN